MFNLEPSSPQPTVDGVPVISLDDDPSDFEEFLAFIIPLDLNFPSLEGKSHKTICSIVSLARRYSIADLYKAALAVFDQRAPSSFETLSKIDEGLAPEVTVDIITLCQADDLHRYLPLAYYQLAISDSRGDVQKAIQRLSPEDRLRIQSGGTALKEALMKELTNFAQVTVCSGSRCQGYRDHALLWLLSDFRPLTPLPNLIELDQIHGVKSNGDDAPCKWALLSCENALREGNIRWRREIYNRLPDMFSLGDVNASESPGIVLDRFIMEDGTPVVGPPTSESTTNALHGQ